jgi:hypothetical protein
LGCGNEVVSGQAKTTPHRKKTIQKIDN